MNYHNITKDDMLNGLGLRVVLWVAGCSHNCYNCHNPTTHNVWGGIPFEDDAVEELYEELGKDYIDGITLSGGDPLHLQNRERITLLCKDIREKFQDKNIWIYTGFLYEDIEDLEVLNYIDILVDGQYIESLADVNAPFVGSTNQRVIDVRHTKELGLICCIKI